MMSYLISFFFMLVISSAIVFVTAQLYTAIEPRARNWPAFWASALIMICTLPILGLLFTQFSFFKPVINIDISAFHAPMSQMDVIASDMIIGSSIASHDIGSLLEKSVMGIYLMGLFFQCLKLIIGRGKARRIAKDALRVKGSNGLEFWQTETLTSPFAITPFNRPQEVKNHYFILFHQSLIHRRIRDCLGT